MYLARASPKKFAFSKHFFVFRTRFCKHSIPLCLKGVTFGILRTRWSNINRKVGVWKIFQSKSNPNMLQKIIFTWIRIIFQKCMLETITRPGRYLTFCAQVHASSHVKHKGGSSFFFISQRPRINNKTVIIQSEITFNLEFVDGFKTVVSSNYLSFRPTSSIY